MLFRLLLCKQVTSSHRIAQVSVEVSWKLAGILQIVHKITDTKIVFKAKKAVLLFATHLPSVLWNLELGLRSCMSPALNVLLSVGIPLVRGPAGARMVM